MEVYGMSWKEPDLSGRQDATPAERDYAKRFTRIRPAEEDDDPDGTHLVYLVVGNQSFQIGVRMENADSASLLCWMLAKALLRVGP